MTKKQTRELKAWRKAKKKQEMKLSYKTPFRYSGVVAKFIQG